MEEAAIEHLEMIAKELTAEAKQKREWGQFGNSWGHSESKKLLEFCAEVLLSIADTL